MEHYKFTLKVRPAWDNGKLVEKYDEEGKPDGYKIEFETEPDVREIKIIQPFAPSTYSQVLKHLSNKEQDQAGHLILSQYMDCSSEDDKKLLDRILKDGRLLFSCLNAMSPIFDLCETELKKD